MKEFGAEAVGQSEKAALFLKRGKGKKGAQARKRSLSGELSAKMTSQDRSSPGQAMWTCMGGFRVCWSQSVLVQALPVVVIAIINCHGAGGCVT